MTHEIFHTPIKKHRWTAMHLNMSPGGLVALMHREGFRRKAYEDEGGTRTIGWGHTGGVKAGEEIDEAEGRELLDRDVAHCELTIKRLVTVPMAQCEFDAAVSFVFNIGGAAFARSSTLRLLNERKYDQAGQALMLWVKVGGQVNKGLWLRRKSELDQWSRSFA